MQFWSKVVSQVELIIEFTIYYNRGVLWPLSMLKPPDHMRQLIQNSKNLSQSALVVEVHRVSLNLHCKFENI